MTSSGMSGAVVIRVRVPGAARHEMTRCRPGTPVLARKLGPGSALHHFVLQRIRDTTVRNTSRSSAVSFLAFAAGERPLLHARQMIVSAVMVRPHRMQQRVVGLF